MFMILVINDNIINGTNTIV
uniref:Uncharacterized protein n=1 Tax=Arundo donax TaxID=35708 RepID=A0A0A9AL54_ARUDO